MQEYGQDICPENGEISYVDGTVQCSIHSGADDVKSDEEDDSVPYL